jgi:hypothetical protein
LVRSDNPGITALSGINNAESVGKLANSFRVENAFSVPFPGLSLRSNPGLKLANAEGVDENLLKKTRTRKLATPRLHRESQFKTPPGIVAD